MQPKKGETVELKGLVAKSELNGCIGVVTKPYDQKWGCSSIWLDDGTTVNAKAPNIVICEYKMILKLNDDKKKLKLNDPDNKRTLEVALVKLKHVDGVENPASEDNSENHTAILRIIWTNYWLLLIHDTILDKMIRQVVSITRRTTLRCIWVIA